VRARTSLAVACLAGTALLAGATAAEPASRQVSIGLVFQNTSLDDPYQSGVLVGLRRAVRELGVTVKTIAAPPLRSSQGSYRYLVQHGYDLILTYGFFESGEIARAALKYPDGHFAIVDASVRDQKQPPRNLHGGDFRTEQPAFLAGYLAALLERRRPGKDVIGSVGGVRIPTVDSYIAGYRAGARTADPGIRLLNGYSDDFAIAAKCQAIALDQIARGAGAIFQVADHCGLGALGAAKARGVWGIGVDSDESSLGPFVLTSVVKRLDVAVFDTIKSFQDGKLRFGTDTVFDLRNGGVELGKISPRVPASLVARLEPIRAAIEAGKIHVPSELQHR